MTQPRKTLEKLLAGAKTLRFAEFEALLDACGFELKRTRGSHRIYTHPLADRPLSVQPRDGEAKRYQLRQFLDMLEEFGISLDKG